MPVDVETFGAGSSFDGPKIDRSLKTSQLRAKPIYAILSVSSETTGH